MTRIDVDPNELSNFGSMLYGKRGEIESVQRSVESALNFNWQSASRGNMMNRWNEVRSGLRKLARETGDLSSFVKAKAQSFHEADKHSSNSIGAIAGKWAPYAAPALGPVGAAVGSAVLARRQADAYLAMSPKDRIETLEGSRHGVENLHHAYHIAETASVVHSGAYAGAASSVGDMVGGVAVFAAVTGVVFNGAQNWERYGDEGVEKVIGATYVDTALDVGLRVGGAAAGGAAGAALGGLIGSLFPGPGTAVGAYIGGKFGAIAGSWVGGQVAGFIKEQAWWEDVREGAADVLRFQREVSMEAAQTAVRGVTRLQRETARIGRSIQQGYMDAAGEFGRRLFGGGQPVPA